MLEGEASVDERLVRRDGAPAQYRAVIGSRPVRWSSTGICVSWPNTPAHASYAATLSARRAAAPKRDTQVSNYARKTGNWSVVPTLLDAGAVGTTSGSLGRATGIISMDMGMGMRVSAPLAILTAQTHAARRGILIRSGRALEMLAQADTIVLDLASPVR